MAATSHESDSHPAFLEKLCLGFLQALVTEKIGFKFHISSGDFVCSLDFNGAVSPTQTRSPTVKVKRKSPSTRKRNADRRRLFLENKKRTGPISVDTDQARSAAASLAQVKARESQLDKVPEAEEKEERKATGDRLVWIDGQPALVPETVDIASVYPEASLDLNPWPIHLQQENSGGSAESLDTSSDPSRDEIVEVTEFMQFNINDPTSTLGPSRDLTDPSASGVTAEPIDPNRCLRPLQRARERRAARLKEPSDLRSHLRESSVLNAWEQERVFLFCEQCNNKLTDSDWLQFKNEGRNVENVTHCYPCMDSILMANFVPPTSSLM